LEENAERLFEGLEFSFPFPIPYSLFPISRSP